MSAFLLDTNALIYSTTTPGQLGKRARAAIESADALYISAASLWEIAIKHRKRPELMPQSARAFNAYAAEIGIQVISVDATVINALELIEDFRHEDPFDRIIVATSKERVLPLITEDGTLRDYLRNTVW
jgi:PIN domain nuclease of toxin-antitoxin system